MNIHVTRAVPILMLLPVLGFLPGVFAQERRGPTTLENLLQEHADVMPHGTVARPRHGTTDPAITAAWERYGTAVRAASTRLLQQIDKVSRQAKPASTTDAAAGLDAAKKGFVEQGRLPSLLDAELRNARRETEAAYREAARALGQHYDTAAANLRKTNHDEEAEALAQEWALLQSALDVAKEPQLDSTWKHSIANGQSAEITLYSNGTVNAPDGPDTWTLTATTLVIRWRNPDAPGGEWVDTCEVARHAGAYSGTNQLGTRITGTRVP